MGALVEFEWEGVLQPFLHKRKEEEEGEEEEEGGREEE